MPLCVAFLELPSFLIGRLVPADLPHSGAVNCPGQGSFGLSGLGERMKSVGETFTLAKSTL